MVKLDILAFGAHPDDVELSCGGTLLSSVQSGKKVGIVDMTKGELGTRGDAETRLIEATAAGEILGVSVRKNLGFADGFFLNDRQHQLEIIKVLRQYQPDIVLANAINDRHPDHGRAANLIKEAVFLSGLRKINTIQEGKEQEAWRPIAVYNYIQALHIEPDFVVDISEFIEKKMDAVKAYRSQFYDPNSNEPETFISSPQFIESLNARASLFGQTIGVKYGEGFTKNRYLGVNDITSLF